MDETSAAVIFYLLGAWIAMWGVIQSHRIRQLQDAIDELWKAVSRLQTPTDEDTDQ